MSHNNSGLFFTSGLSACLFYIPGSLAAGLSAGATAGTTLIGGALTAGASIVAFVATGIFINCFQSGERNSLFLFGATIAASGTAAIVTGVALGVFSSVGSIVTLSLLTFVCSTVVVLGALGSQTH